MKVAGCGLQVAFFIHPTRSESKACRKKSVCPIRKPMPSSNTSVQPKMKIGRLSKNRNPQPGCVFVFQLHFHLSYEAYETQLYIVYYFFIFNFIYIRYTYAHTHAKGNSKKVAGCGLRFRDMPKSATCNFATRNLL